MKERFEDSDDGRLEALLQMKRFEHPDDKRWQEFMHGLKRKQLAAIVDIKPREKHAWWCVVFNRRIGYAFAALCLCATIGIYRYVSASNDEQYYDQIVEASSSSLRSYVCDSLVPDCVFRADQGVKFSLSTRGVGYVQDAIIANVAVHSH